MDPTQIQGWQAVATLLSGPLGGWAVAWLMGKQIDKKDQQLLNKHDAHIKSLEASIEAGKEDTRACHSRFELVLQRLFALEDKKADKQ